MNAEFWDKGIKLVSGCTKVSEGCKNCWAEKKQEGRFYTNPCYEGLTTDGKFNGAVRFNLHLLRNAMKAREPRIYAIWNDLYHPGITDDQIFDAFNLMHDSQFQDDTILIVTKRPERAAKLIGGSSGTGLAYGWPHNIWHIVTCENQARADERIPELLKVPTRRGLIVEPMLEAIDIRETALCGHTINDDREWAYYPEIHQVLLGPENGTGKRPFDEAWAEDVREQCEAAGVPYYRKDTGEGSLVWKGGTK